MRYLFLLLFSIQSLFTIKAQPTNNTLSNQLEKYVGYYDVGVKPGKLFFKARAYIRESNLYIIFDSDQDHKLSLKEDHTFSFEFDSASRYSISFHANGDMITGFKVVRPRSEWPTDLFGDRNEALSKYAVDTEAQLSLTRESPHFRFQYSDVDTSYIQGILTTLERNYHKIINSFKLDTIASTTIRIYPDKKTYHNAVLTPEAPDWQMGRSWSKHEIRMLSPLIARQTTGEDINVNEIVLHEFVHCVHLNLIKDGTRVPGWLWEGLAMYKGCCLWTDLKDLDYIQSKKYPTLKKIEDDRSYQMKYDLGYFLIDFVDKQYGWDKVLQLIAKNGDIKAALNKSRKDFEEDFYRFLEDTHLPGH